MKFLLLVFFSLSAFAQVLPDRPDCPERFRLEAVEGAEKLLLYDGSAEIILRAPPGLRFVRDSDRRIIFTTDPGDVDVIVVPRFDAVNVPGTDVFTLTYTTREESGICNIDAVTEEEL